MTDPVVTNDGVVERQALLIARETYATHLEVHGSSYVAAEVRAGNEDSNWQLRLILAGARAALAASDRVVLVERIDRLDILLSGAEQCCQTTVLITDVRAALVSLDEELTK